MTAYPITPPAAQQKIREGFLTDLADSANDHETRLSAIEVGSDTFHNFTIASPFANRSGSWLPSQYTKLTINGANFVLFYIVVTGTPAGNGQLICTLPVGYRPAYIQNFAVSGIGSSTTNTPTIEVSTDGTCKLYDEALSSSNWHMGWQYLKL